MMTNIVLNRKIRFAYLCVFWYDYPVHNKKKVEIGHE